MAVRSAVAILGVGAAAAVTWLARSAILLGFLAVLLAVVLSFPVGWLQRVLRRRGLAVLAVLLLAGLAIAGLVSVAAGPLSDQAAAVVESAPQALQRARSWLARIERTSTPPGQPAEAPRAAPQPPLTKAAEIAVPAAAGAVELVTEVVLVIVLAAFLVNEPGVYRRGLRRFVPRGREELYDELWRRLGDGLRRWVGGIFVSMAIMGALTALGLELAGVENWLLLGVLTFLGTFVPYVGAVVSAVPGLLVAAGQSSRHLLGAVAVYLAIHLIEGYIVEPLIMRRAVALKPAVLLGSQAVFAAVFGPIGVVVATPAVVCLQIAADLLWIERRLGKTP